MDTDVYQDAMITTCCSDFEAAHFSGSVPTAFNETLLHDQAEHHGEHTADLEVLTTASTA